MSNIREQMIARKLLAIARAQRVSVGRSGRNLLFTMSDGRIAAYPLYRPAIVSESVVRSR